MYKGVHLLRYAFLSSRTIFMSTQKLSNIHVYPLCMFYKLDQFKHHMYGISLHFFYHLVVLRAFLCQYIRTAYFKNCPYMEDHYMFIEAYHLGSFFFLRVCFSLLFVNNRLDKGQTALGVQTVSGLMLNKYFIFPVHNTCIHGIFYRIRIVHL